MNTADAADVGLLSPGRAGTAVEQATGDTAWLQAMLDAEAALNRAQASLGFIPPSAAATVGSCADADAYDVRGIALRARAGGNPVIPLVADLTAAVAARDPHAAEYVHQGATSQDILDTAAMLVSSRALGMITTDLDRAAVALRRLAAEHRDTPLPGRTLTQHAVPTTFGLKAAGWHQLVLDARSRLGTLLGQLPAQLGGAAGTLAAFDAYANANACMDTAGVAVTTPGIALLAEFARELGLAEPLLPWHTLRTPIADLGAALAFTAGALGKIAADVLLATRTETGELAESVGGGSSAMPHKSNPVRSTLIAAAARHVGPLATVLIGSLVSEDERPAGTWHAEWQILREALRLVGGAAEGTADLTEGLRVDARRMRAHLDLTGGLVVSERLSIALTRLLGRAEARRVSEDAARRSVREGRGLGDVLAADPALRKHLDAAEIAALLDPTTYTGSAAALVDRALSVLAEADARSDSTDDRHSGRDTRPRTRGDA